MVKRVRVEKLRAKVKKTRPVQDGPGRPEFQPTEDDRRLVRLMRQQMVSQAAMCEMVYNPRTGKPIDIKTLVQYFAVELAQAETEAAIRVGSALYQLAVGRPLTTIDVPKPTARNPNATTKRFIMPRDPDLGAIMWWERTRRKLKEGDEKPAPNLLAPSVVIILPPNNRDVHAKVIEHEPAGPRIKMPSNGRAT